MYIEELDKALDVGDILQITILCENASVSDLSKALLHICAKPIGVPSVVSILLDRGADVHIRDHESFTPLHMIFGNRDISSHMECIRLLAEYGIDINSANMYGETPLHLACEKRYTEGTKLLISHWADVNVKDNGNSTPLHRASERGDMECVQLLLAHGADINSRGLNGYTPLQLAIGLNHTGCVEELLLHGADVTIRNRDGRTAYDIAKRNGYSHIVDMLSR